MWQCALLSAGEWESVCRQARQVLCLRRGGPVYLKLTLSTFAIPGEAVEARGRPWTMAVPRLGTDAQTDVQTDSRPQQLGTWTINCDLRVRRALMDALERCPISRSEEGMNPLFPAPPDPDPYDPLVFHPTALRSENLPAFCLQNGFVSEVGMHGSERSVCACVGMMISSDGFFGWLRARRTSSEPLHKPRQAKPQRV